MKTNYFAKQFEDDDESIDNTSSSTNNDVSYTFEGFTIELNQKILLTPVSKLINPRSN